MIVQNVNMVANGKRNRRLNTNAHIQHVDSHRGVVTMHFGASQ